MAIRARGQSWSSVLLLIVAALAWGWNEWQKAHSPEKPQPRSAEVQPSRGKKADPSTAYERYDGCVLVPDRLNDGDSFRLRLPNGREETFRLYFVDTPESAFKRYGGGESNQQRIQDQADYFGVSAEDAVELGKKAKAYVLKSLEAKPVTLFTRWDDPFGDLRYHAFIRFEDGDSPAWLDERLVERGLCRIYTRGADLPDGTPMKRHKERLRELEREAKRAGKGGWKK
ncbi:MAG TPA: thermonuclease family protein [Luteolibacter sp.]